jgi:hypothetical protein
MMSIFKAVGERLRALLLADAALDLEAALISRQADRVATLLVEADQHEKHGCPAVAAELRRQAEMLSLQRPLATIRPAIEHLQGHEPDPIIDLDPAPSPSTTNTNGNGRRRAARLPGTGAGRT